MFRGAVLEELISCLLWMMRTAWIKLTIFSDATASLFVFPGRIIHFRRRLIAAAVLDECVQGIIRQQFRDQSRGPPRYVRH